jgi:predicted MPP superfamily phosphohydrolase
MPNSSLTIVHVSDTHLRAGSRDWHESLPKINAAPDGGAVLAIAVQKTVLAAAGNDECIGVLSGDLSLLGAIDDIDTALAWWRRAAPAGSIFVFGNHDFWDGRLAHTFLTHKSTHRWVRLARWPLTRHPPIDVGHLRVRFYEIDTTPLNRFVNAAALGALSGQEVRQLRQDTDEDAAEDTGRSVLRIAVAHHPVDTIGRSSRAIRVLRERRVGLFLAGHTHTYGLSREGNGRGVVQAVCASSTLTRPASFLVHRIEPLRADIATVNTTKVELASDGTEVETAEREYQVDVAIVP